MADLFVDPLNEFLAGIGSSCKVVTVQFVNNPNSSHAGNHFKCFYVMDDGRTGEADLSCDDLTTFESGCGLYTRLRYGDDWKTYTYTDPNRKLCLKILDAVCPTRLMPWWKRLITLRPSGSYEESK